MGRPKPLPANQLDIHKAIAKESDRGCVMTGCAWIESLLRELIETALLDASAENQHYSESDHNKGLEDLLSGPTLQPASVRRKLCRAMGLISKKRESCLKLLFDFRNHHFAHWAGHCQLNDQDVLGDLNGIAQSFASETMGDSEAFKAANAAVLDRSKPARERMTLIMIGIVMELHYEIQGLKLRHQTRNLLVAAGKRATEPSSISQSYRAYNGYLPYIQKQQGSPAASRREDTAPPIEKPKPRTKKPKV